jgi:uncharacterized membrane protein
MLFSRKFLRREETLKVEAAIADAEKSTSGEIRVVIARSSPEDVYGAAVNTFDRVGMHKTDRRNGVLIFIAVNRRRFAIIGDEGINRHMGQEGWDRTRDRLAENFSAGKKAEGIIEAIGEVGKVLAAHFPPVENDKNELSNEMLEV